MHARANNITNSLTNAGMHKHIRSMVEHISELSLCCKVGKGVTTKRQGSEGGTDLEGVHSLLGGRSLEEAGHRVDMSVGGHTLLELGCMLLVHHTCTVHNPHQY